MQLAFYKELDFPTDRVSSAASDHWWLIPSASPIWIIIIIIHCLLEGPRPRWKEDWLYFCRYQSNLLSVQKILEKKKKLRKLREVPRVLSPLFTLICAFGSFHMINFLSKISLERRDTSSLWTCGVQGFYLNDCDDYILFCSFSLVKINYGMTVLGIIIL